MKITSLTGGSETDSLKLGDVVIPRVRHLLVWDDDLKDSFEANTKEIFVVVGLNHPKRKKRLVGFFQVLTTSGTAGWVRRD
jgi:hypothetical protein